jgi:LacI family transcriptional regulator
LPTIVDVARLANVSISTVSHVVNGTRPVSDRTRARVEQAIAMTGYSQHGLARALRRNRSDSVGLVVSDTSQHVFGQIIAGVESEARQAGLTLLLANSAEEPAYERESVRTLLDRRVDGLLLAQVAASDAEVLAACRSAGCPVVLIDRLTNPAFDQVGVENVAAMKALSRHLIDVGHADPVLLAGDLGVSTIRDRVRGFEEAMTEAGLNVTADSFVWIGPGLADGHQKVGERLDRHLPSAIIATSGLLTIGALRAFRERGLTIPEDLAFASFDSISNAQFLDPQLTSVVQPAADIGREAMGLLLRRLADPAAGPRTILLQPRIYHGTSCGCDGNVPLPLG